MGVSHLGRTRTRPESSSDAPVAAIVLREADEEVYRQVVDAYRGQVVLVDFWATWCLPCKKNFPKIVSYGQNYGEQGLALVSLSIDDATAREDAREFLKSVKATGTHMISKWGAGTESAERFDFSGEVPFYRLYDRGGKLRYQFCANAETIERVEPLEQIEPRIKELLGEAQRSEVCTPSKCVFPAAESIDRLVDLSHDSQALGNRGEDPAVVL